MRKLSFLLIIVLVTMFIGCSKKNTGTEDGGNHVNSSESPVRKDVYPFTGLETKDQAENRSVAVMVSNQVQDRPQSGLTKADIVYEILVEGNITRFMAIYHSEAPESVGPVRSAREYFFTLAQGYDAIYVYQGAANFVNEMIQERNIDHLQGAMYDNDGHLFVREDFRDIPYNSYLQFGAVHEVAADKGYEVEKEYEALSFMKEADEIIGDDANYVKLDYYGGVPIVEFMYNEDTEKYRRYHDQEITYELASEEDIQIDNLFIVEADHTVFDDVGRRAIDLEAGGNAYLLQKGKVQYVEWKNIDGKILPVKDDEVLPFVAGQTWISFVQTVPQPGVKQQVTIENK